MSPRRASTARPAPFPFPLAKRVERVPAGSIAVLRAKAADCTACPLWRGTTHTVFGAGRTELGVVLVGEQPGNHEDLQGLPFVGAAGRLLDEALAAAGLERDALYLTNAVKHFKHEMRGKLRLHRRANAAEQAACRPWLAAELLAIRPRIVVALGAMAAQTIFGNAFRISHERGRWHDHAAGYRALATWHPAAVLRTRDPERAVMRRQLFQDIAAVRAELDRT